MSNQTIEEAIVTAEDIRHGAVDVTIGQSNLRARVKNDGRVGLYSTLRKSSSFVEVKNLGGQNATSAARNLNLDDIQLSKVAKRQVANAIGIPVPYWKRCEESNPEMLVDHINHWLPQSASRRMIRMVTDDSAQSQHCRAFLSDRFMPVENEWVLNQLGQTLPSEDSTPWRIYVDENGMNFSSRSDVMTKALDDSHSKKIGDVMQGGIRVLNSEVGGGKIVAQLCLYRLVCLNGMTMPIGLGGYSRRHVGNSSTEVLSDLRGSIENILGGDQFNVAMERIAGAINQQMAKDWISRLVKDNDLTDDEEESLKFNYNTDQNLLNLWGAVNAVTALAHQTKSIDRKTELEAIGGRLLTSPRALIAA